MTGDDDLASTLSALHAAAFDQPWTAAAIRTLLASPGVTALWEADGFVLLRTVADEAEILTLAVRPEVRRRGLGRSLVERAAKAARRAGAERLLLEVAADNDAALTLYRRAGFQPLARRKGYYARKDKAPIDALVLTRPLASPA